MAPQASLCGVISESQAQERTPAAGAMKVWYEFMETTRHWELEPFGDSPQARGVGLDGVEYVLYVDKPGPVTVKNFG